MIQVDANRSRFGSRSFRRRIAYAQKRGRELEKKFFRQTLTIGASNSIDMRQLTLWLGKASSAAPPWLIPTLKKIVSEIS